MSDGQKAAESTKSLFSSAQGASESIRQNINSFADSLVGNKEHGSGTIHPDAKQPATQASKAVDEAKANFNGGANHGTDKADDL